MINIILCNHIHRDLKNFLIFPILFLHHPFMTKQGNVQKKNNKNIFPYSNMTRCADFPCYKNFLMNNDFSICGRIITFRLCFC